MPWMPDKMPSLQNGLKNGVNKRRESKNSKVDVKAIENRILSSTEHLNEILSLNSLINGAEFETITEVATSLTKIFKNLRNHGKMTLAAGIPQDSPEAQIVTWLNERYADFIKNLLGLLDSGKGNLQLISMTVCLRAVKDETASKDRETAKFANRTYAQLVDSFLQCSQLAEIVQKEFCDKYLNNYYDLQLYFLQNAAYFHPHTVLTVEKLCKVTLSSLVPLLPSEGETPEMFTSLPPKASLLNPTTYKVAFQAVWLGHLRHPLDQKQLKDLLLVIHKRIIPYMNNPQRLLDWLTDSYNSGGSISLLALNGLWELMQKYNLDYPEFYTKLYALFTPTLFHTRYLARFLRLSELFLSSSYLPAALVASFIKRLSRLSLSAPPQGIVAIFPMVYNLLKRHPSCMQIIHRPDSLPGRPDPFDAEESDPLKTRALDSSLWELASMTNHYNPNVSSLAKILSEVFTKPSYNMEDFLDHSYGTMLDAELARKQKSAPTINHEKPNARINEGNSIVARLWEL